jgi:hypothetical protein
VNARAHLAPALDRTLEAVLLDRLHSPVHRHPGHHLRIRELLRLTAYFPDTAVRTLPVRFQKLHQRPLKVPRVGIGVEPGRPREKQCVHQLTVDVELN